MSHPGATVDWSIPEGSITHQIVDGTGLRLFNSGPLTAPASYSQSFFAAGGYFVMDQGTGSAMTLEVPVLADPPSGGLTTRFHITWGSHRVRGNRVFDVQIQRPGSPDFVNWLTGQRSASVFVPDAGTGVYSFRARLRSIAEGGASAYSQPVSILVS